MGRDLVRKREDMGDNHTSPHTHMKLWGAFLRVPRNMELLRFGKIGLVRNL